VTTAESTNVTWSPQLSIQIREKPNQNYLTPREDLVNQNYLTPRK